jgi:hypothetical protein
MQTERIVVLPENFDIPSGSLFLFQSTDSEDPGSMIIHFFSLRPYEAQIIESFI